MGAAFGGYGGAVLRGCFGLVVRQILAFGLGAGMLVLLVVVVLSELERPTPGVDLWLVFRGGTRFALISVIIGLLVLEGPRVKGQILQRARALHLAGQPARRADRFFEGPLGFLLVTAVIVVAYLSRFLWTLGDGGGSWCGLAMEVVVVWLALRAALWLVLGWWTRWRLGRRARRLQPPPLVAPAFPLLVAAEVMVCLLLLWVRLPHVFWADVGLEVAGVGHRTELLVELGPDDSILEITDTLARNDATWSQAAPSAPWGSDASRTWVVSAKTRSVPFLFMDLLVSEEENVVDLDLNPRLAASTDRPVGSCSMGFGGVTNDPYSAGQSALRESGADAVLEARGTWSRGWRSERARLAVIDSGVDAVHEDLLGIVVKAPPAVERDHGTAIAGIAAGHTTNRRGLASLNVQGHRIAVYNYPAFGNGDPHADDLADAIYQAVRDDADVIVMAFAAPGPTPPVVSDALDHAGRRDVILIAAAGNDRELNADEVWPSRHRSVIGVPALDGGRLASFSSSAGSVSISAPGAEICGPMPGNRYAEWSGSSMAAAFLAGVVADRRYRCPRDGAVDVLSAVISSADPPIGGSGVRLNVLGLERVQCAN